MRNEQEKAKFLYFHIYPHAFSLLLIQTSFLNSGATLPPYLTGQREIAYTK